MKKIIKTSSLLLVTVMLVWCTIGFASALPYDTLQSDGSLVFDDADILTDSEEASLEEMLYDISTKHNMDIAVVTVYSLNGKHPQDFADDYYDYNGYGQGVDFDGAVLMISTEYRDWHFSTSGRAISAFTDKTIDYIFSSDNVLYYFSDNDWYGGFKSYANMCDSCLTAYEKGKDYPGKSSSDYLKMFGVCILIGFGVALLFIKSVMNKHKSVRKKAEANDYLVNGSLQLDQSYDTFLYRNVVSTPKSTSSSGSSTHTSSSGRTHGGGGGKF